MTCILYIGPCPFSFSLFWKLFKITLKSNNCVKERPYLIYMGHGQLELVVPPHLIKLDHFFIQKLSEKLPTLFVYIFIFFPLISNIIA